ncbi:hypothetical protein R1Y80_00750 [Streptomyces sp. JL1001]|uniref:Uncharacterized protein n=1 Tax=Streptomyces sp. JL1001 TaxID=3078227 RepID=A0AAU8K9A1_9ACTN
MSGPLQKYRYVGKSGETVLKLNEADAARLGLGPDDVVGASGDEGVQTLSLPADDKPAPANEPKQNPTAQNKARATSANKRRAPRKSQADEQGQGGDEQQAAPQDGGDGGPGGGD